MKEAIGGSWLFGIVVTFIVFFSTYISMSTNYAKSFKVKDEILLTVEHFKGVNDSSIERINNYLNRVGYFSKGNCDGYDESIANTTKAKYSKWLGFTTGSKNASSVKNANYCIRRASFSSGAGDAGHPRSAHYQVVVFFSLDWPVIGSLINVRIEGETSIIHMYNDDSKYNFVG